MILAPQLVAQTAFEAWQQVGPEGGPLSGLIVDPADDARWLALSGTQLHEKRGDGDWRQIANLPSGTGDLLAADGPTLYATSVGSQVVITSVAWRSEDSGATWQDLQIPNGPNIEIIALERTADGMLFATSDGLWRFQAGSWTLLFDARFLDFAVSDDGSLAAALIAPNGATERQVLRSGDGGATWETLGGLSPRTVESIAVSVPFIYAIGSEADGTRFTASRLDGPGLWAVVPAAGLPATPFRSSLFAADANGSDILLSYRPPQTYRSSDLGRSWQPLDFGIGAVSVQAYEFTRVPGGPWIASGLTGAWSSDDGGASWQEENGGLFLHFIDAFAVDPQRSDELYVRSTSGETFASEDGGATWRRLPLGPAAGDLTVLGTEPRSVLIGASNGIFRSGDGGQTWQLQEAGSANREHIIESFAVDPKDPRRLVAAGRDQEAQTPFRKAAHWWSENAGATWSRGADIEDFRGIASAAFEYAGADTTASRVFFAGEGGVFSAQENGSLVIPLPGAGDFAFTLAVDRFETGRLLAFAPNRLIRSLDSGLTWIDINVDPPFDQASDLRPDPRVQDRYWAESGAGLWRSDDAGETWQLATPSFPDLVNTFDFDPRFPRSVYAGAWRNGLLRLILAEGQGCDHPQILCLSDGRFVLESRWRDFADREGVGQKADLTADTGYFWFFDPANVELVTKVLDGRGFNGNYWVFYGSLSNVEFGLKVTDTKSQQVVTYQNPSGNFASVGDTAALPELFGLGEDGAIAGPPALKVEGCDDVPDTICLGDRFRLSTTWRDFEGRTGVGTPNDLTTDTAYFTFFSPTNVELMVKVLDGTGFNGRYWVFFASLSNVEFTLTVEDLETGAIRRYENPIGNFASVGDTSAF